MGDPIDDLIEMMRNAAPDGERRPHHYFFAHHLFRDFVFDQGSQVRSAALDGTLTLRLRAIWRMFGGKLDDADRLSDDGLAGSSVMLGPTLLVVVRFPTPERVAEAHFVGALLPDGAPPRYLTLERGRTAEGADRTVLCEWDRDRHANYGTGPAATEEAFVAAVAGLVGTG